MLMTLFNVRLGLLGPPEPGGDWKMPRARLWPVLRAARVPVPDERSCRSYCYLTDGGHFDNTGLYSLVERGCRYDRPGRLRRRPASRASRTWADAIRRCRIDFRQPRSELDRGASSREAPGAPTAGVHYVVGHVIRYDRGARASRWAGADRCGATTERDDRGGMKPSRQGRWASADVRQYALENDAFPQQTTADQWFGEAQFESYRRLGMECARAALSDSEVAAAFPVG